MKSVTYIIGFLLLFTIAACKKDKTADLKETEKNVQGIWFTTNEQHVYYDNNNVELLRETKTIGYKYQLSVENNIRIYTPEGNQLFKKPFELSNSSGKLFITYSDNTGPQTFEVVSANETTMKWEQITSNQPYENGTKTAAKKVVTIDFHCPCPE